MTVGEHRTSHTFLPSCTSQYGAIRLSGTRGVSSCAAGRSVGRRGGVPMTTPITATFLFTDLVGSTALASRLGPDAAEAAPMIEPLRVGVIVLLLEVGDVAGARERFERERARELRVQPVGTAPDSCRRCRHRGGPGREEAAALLLDRLARHQDRIVYALAISPHPVARRGRPSRRALGRHEEAEHAFTTALADCERLGAPYWTGRTYAERAEMYARAARAGDPGARRARPRRRTAARVAVRRDRSRASRRTCPCRAGLIRRLRVLHRVA